MKGRKGLVADSILAEIIFFHRGKATLLHVPPKLDSLYDSKHKPRC